MGHEPSNTFLTSLLQLKLDKTTQLEWQKHNQDRDDVSPYKELLEFISLREQATETLTPESFEQKKAYKGDLNAVVNPPICLYPIWLELAMPV